MPDLPNTTADKITLKLTPISTLCMNRGEADIYFWGNAIIKRLQPEEYKVTLAYVLANLERVLARAERGEFVLKAPISRDPWVPREVVLTTLPASARPQRPEERIQVLEAAVLHFLRDIVSRYKAAHPDRTGQVGADADTWGEEMETQYKRQVDDKKEHRSALLLLLLKWRDELIIMTERLRNHQKLYPALNPLDNIAHHRFHNEPLGNTAPIALAPPPRSTTADADPIGHALAPVVEYCAKRGEDLEAWVVELRTKLGNARQINHTKVVQNLNTILARIQRGELVNLYPGVILDPHEDKWHEYLNNDFYPAKIINGNISPALRSLPLEIEPWVPVAVVRDIQLKDQHGVAVPLETLKHWRQHLKDFVRHIAHKYQEHHSDENDKDVARRWETSLFNMEFFGADKHFNPASNELFYIAVSRFQEQLIIVSERVRNRQNLYPNLWGSRIVYPPGRTNRIPPLNNKRPDTDFFPAPHSAHSLARISHRSAQRYGLTGRVSAEGGIEFGRGW
ncbi:hypothetical protein JCM10212_000209 [Sporobolomyces blumeae]